MSEYKGTITSIVKVHITGFKWYQSRTIDATFGNHTSREDYETELEYREALEKEIIEHIEQVDNILEGQWIQAMKDLDDEFEWDSAVREYQLRDWMKGEGNYEGYNGSYIDKDSVTFKYMLLTINTIKVTKENETGELDVFCPSKYMDMVIEAAEQKLEEAIAEARVYEEEEEADRIEAEETV